MSGSLTAGVVVKATFTVSRAVKVAFMPSGGGGCGSRPGPAMVAVMP
jgi:hypothetical protein